MTTTTMRFTTRRIYTRTGKNHDTFDDFECRVCGAFVSVDPALSGVGNRNHCPYCLSSRHLDQFEAGDRLSACKACMPPVGLTIKQVAKKYAGTQHGELMIVHLCEDCGKVSINRIAADDDAGLILSVLAQSTGLESHTRAMLAQSGITLLNADQTDLVQRSLFGTYSSGASHAIPTE